ncbi:unnamed protein product [Lymnaea stagnalis]|uniref:Uncharacterized protein n=1 Tax=Lymnaea stagnalis TaxID=6523 RepID=A0AAV2ID54_LYMST
MPVLLKGSDKNMFPAVDVETLVIEVRDRLCLKNREKFCPSRRSAPYHVNKHVAVCEHCSRKHYSSPESCIHQRHCKHRPNSLCGACSCAPKSRKLSDSPDFEDPHILLEKLIAEQSLIQEAVRRLQSQTKTTQQSDKLFQFVDEDSCDQFSNQTPCYSESEDDSVSQHSVDI